MKFALVGPAHPLRGGIAQYNTALYKALAVRFEPLLISFSRQYPRLLFPGRTQKDESKSPYKVPVEPLFDSVSPSSWRRVADRILEEKPDCVVFQWWQPFFAPAYASVIKRVRRSSSVPILFLCHNILSHEGIPLPGRQLLEQVLTRWVFRFVDGFLVHSEGLVSQLKSYRPSTEVRRIFHPLYDFYSTWDPGPAIPKKTQVSRLLFFGTIRRYKGLPVFLEALSLVDKEISFEAVVAGEFYMDSRPYKDRVRQLGLEKHLVWKDSYIPNEEVPGLFRDTDLVVLPYIQATQSGVVPVAYQFEVPVIASDVGGLSEVVIEGETGYLTPPGDEKALARKIIQYFKEDRKEEFRANIRTVRRKLSWEHVVDSILDLLQALSK